jgi:hypothetical protein
MEPSLGPNLRKQRRLQILNKFKTWPFLATRFDLVAQVFHIILTAIHSLPPIESTKI